ncbi:MAG: beta-lactamase family protein [Colwellia sp.]
MKIFKMLTVAVLINVLGLSSIYASAQAVESSPLLSPNNATTERLNAYFSQLESHNKFIGSVGFYQAGELLYQHASVLDGEIITPIDKTLKYRIGSITKVFTGVMIMQLIEEGKLKLETKLATFYPKVANAKIITISQMLSHHSGIKSFTDDPAFIKLYLSPQSSKTIISMIESYDSAFKPGQKGAYSNSNFYLLSHIIEKLTENSYQENLSSRITAKLDLKNTYYGGIISHKNNEVSSYSWNGDKWKKSEESDMSIPHGAGAIVSTTGDINRFIFGLFSGELLNKTSLASMLEIKNGFGRSIFKSKLGENDTYGHDGAIDQFRSKMIYQPSTKISAVVLSNGLEYKNDLIIDAMMTASKGKLVKLPNFKTIDLSIAQLNKFTGEYKSSTSSFR